MNERPHAPGLALVKRPQCFRLPPRHRQQRSSGGYQVMPQETPPPAASSGRWHWHRDQNDLLDRGAVPTVDLCGLKPHPARQPDRVGNVVIPAPGH